MKVGDLISSMKFQMPQNVANMIVIPIVSDRENKDISGEMILQIAKDQDYGRLTIENVDNKPVIVPQGVRFSTKGKGQDRTVLSTTVIEAEGEKELHVGCVAPSDAAHITIGKKDFSFMPTKIRIPSLLKQNTTEFNVLWGDIENYLKGAGIQGRAIDSFYEHFNKELEEFVAQFEPLDKQLGAVVLINNEVAGIEIYPNYLAWSRVWRLLIRDSYGADAIKMIRDKTYVSYKPVVDLDRIETFKDLEEQVQKVKVEFISFVNAKVTPLLDKEIDLTEREVSQDFKVYNVSNPNFIGQLITKGDQTVYISLLRSDKHPPIQPEAEVEEDEDW